MKVTIHQPNFFPWYPFFQKMESADIFVLLRWAQFVKGNYHNRFDMNGKWYTMAVDQRTGFVPIIQKAYINPVEKYEAIMRRLPKYKKLLDLFYPFITINVAITNSLIIHQIRDLLQIETKIVEDSKTSLQGTERLVNICETLGATEYLAGTSGSKYLDFSLFEKAGIKVTTQDADSIIKKPILEVLDERKIV